VAFDATLTMDDASGDDVVYNLTSTGQTGTTRLDAATTLAAPGVMKIAHSTSGKGKTAVDRHLVQMTRTFVDSTSEATLVVNFTLQVPRSTLITEQVIYDQVSNLLDFLAAGGIATVTTTNIQKLIRGES
jgi:hypothetical protein